MEPQADWFIVRRFSYKKTENIWALVQCRVRLCLHLPAFQLLSLTRPIPGAHTLALRTVCLKTTERRVHGHFSLELVYSVQSV